MLTCLQKLALTSITLPDLSLLLPLTNLSRLTITLGGTKNLEALPKSGHIRFLDVYRVRGLTDLTPIGQMEFLEHLSLQDLNRVEGLPSMKRLIHLKRIDLINVKGVTDLSPLLEAPQLEEIAVVKAPHLAPSAFACLRGHPSLKRLSGFLGSKKANDAVSAMFGLPHVEVYGHLLLDD